MSASMASLIVGAPLAGRQSGIATVVRRRFRGLAPRTLVDTKDRCTTLSARSTTRAMSGWHQHEHHPSTGSGFGRRRFATGPAADDKNSHVRLMLDTKVSPTGTADALFDECLAAIRQRRAEQEIDAEKGLYEDTPQITKLKQDEVELTRKIFKRVDPTRDLTSDYEHAGHHIDPYWSPFHKVRDLKEQVTAEFDEYARCVSVAEQKRIRIQIKKSLRKSAEAYNPYTPGFANYHGRKMGSDEPPRPFHLHDKHWERTPLQERLGQERITWRDLDIIQHCMADNGYILPRRTTMLSVKKQKELVKAVKVAQIMALLPYNWKLPDYQAMPLMDPLQWMVDRLTDRVVEARDKRSRAMLKVMIEKHPELNYRRFLKHEAARPPADAHGQHLHAAANAESPPPPF